jgi:peptide/nickel transport system substrate-binding protein
MNSSKKRLFAVSSVIASASMVMAVAAVPAQAAAPAQGSAPTRQETMILDIDGGKVLAPDMWNPYVPGNRRDQGFHQSMIEPMFILNYMTGKIDPWLGVSMTANKTQDVWTLKLNPKATWNDGKPVTADDVIFSIDMYKKTKEFGDSATVNEWVKSTKKIDDKTVEFTLNKANPRFQLDYWAVKIWGGWNIVPKHIWEGKDPLTFKNYEKGKSPVFSGPYKLTSFNSDGTEFIYDRDDNWWGAKSGFKKLPAPKRLIWTWAGSPEQRVALMADKKLDSLMDITKGAYETLKAKNPNVIAWYKDLPYAVLDPCSRVFGFNTTVKPWDDPEMRWAVNYAIDRDQIVKIAYEGTTSKSRMPYPMYPPIQRLDKLLESKGVYEKYPIWTFDPKKSMEIFEKKGYTKGADGYYAKDGKQLSLVINTHEAFIEKQRITDVLVEQFQAVGINASHVKQAGQLWDDNRNMGKFEAQMGWQMCGSVSEPFATLDNLNAKWLKPVGERASANGWRWDNAEYSKLVDQMGTLPLGDPKVDDLFVKASEIMYKELPIIPITQAKKLIPFDTTYWTNWPSDSNKYAPSWTWWQSFYEILTAVKPAGK